MPRDPNVPDEFDVYTVVVLRRPADAPEMSDEELVTQWWVGAGSLAFPRTEGPVGDRRSMPGD